jgi:lysophospholipase L1-like esterase
MIIAPGSSLLFIGDSITDCGRNRPVGESNHVGLGNGYVSLVDSYLKMKHGSSRIRVQNTGISGNTVRDLAARWDEDVFDLEPDWVSVMIGINDVWRQFDTYLEVENHVRLPEYRSTLNSLVGMTKEKCQGVVVMSPFIAEPNVDDPMRSLMDEYGSSAMDIARKHDAIFVDVQGELDAFMEHVPNMALCSDRIHLAQSGHMMMAFAFLEAIRAV